MADQTNVSSFSVWDALSILILMGVCIVGILIVSIFANPASAFNPFPPPTLPAAIILPSDTPTPVAMPATWTPVGGAKVVEKVASQTPVPSATAFVLPSFTPTFTLTPSLTSTETTTDTEVPTNTHVPHTATPRPTTALVCLQVSQSISLVSPPDATTAGAYSGSITLKGDSRHKVSGASVSFSTSKKTTVSWTCSGSNGSCPGSGKSFSVSSIKMFANGSVTIQITGVIPKGAKSGITFKSSVHAPSGTSNQCNPNAGPNTIW